MVVTLPVQHLTRPCLAESILAIALGSAVGRVNLLVQVQCSIASKTQSAELKSSETLVLCISQWSPEATHRPCIKLRYH